MVCSLAVAAPGEPEPAVEIFTGVVDGTVAPAPRGEGGFGYDPIFLLPSGTTTAELPEAEKDRISHRGRSVAAALTRLAELLERN
jgi:XTP/dITP diphosphohydrolase